MSEPAVAPEAAARTPGRPRSEKAHQAILESTLTVLGESGIAGLSIEAVAARAGVGKATIYRRWESKEELILAALAIMSPAGPVPDTGSLEGDLTALAQGTGRARLADTVLPRVAPRALAEAMGDADLHALRARADDRPHAGEARRRWWSGPWSAARWRRAPTWTTPWT